MKPFFCLAVVSALLLWIGNSSTGAQPKDPPKVFTNSIGMKFAWIPRGSFLMGSPEGEVKRKGTTKLEAQHKVTLTKGFYMGVYTVTQEQWQEVMGNNPSHFKGEKNLPVEMVSWEDCQEFIKKLREKDKKPYRLPTEAEWEYSCRAGTTTRFHFGETISPEQANYSGGTPGPKGIAPIDGKRFRGKTTPVGSFPANAWGLHDMHGNIMQHCQDWYGEYPEQDVIDPQGPNTGKNHVRRGGAWSFPSVLIRSAHRAPEQPAFRSRFTGVRLCFFLE